MNTKKTIISILIVLIYMCNQETCYAQIFGKETGKENSDAEKKGTKFTGGGLGIQFGTITLIDVSPHFGYYVTDRLSAAIGGTFAYYRDKRYSPTLEETMYGARAFARFDIIKELFIHAELEALNLEYNNSINNNSLNLKRDWFISPLVGAAFRQNLSDYTSYYLMVLWNFNENLYYPYSNPLIRVGIDFGL